ncbi:hypothetical protein QYE76_023364 [Lolium multiflorum]|uniref:Retrotransposon Copia-like N-terminal domain-containing protein n=1 Tax=Lolium multiflorum TaxID=4521 RepID=A0AAD8RCQ9_LOLMU|nr:hypothetical protein QYE76_023364 [Lolium multiflorum]
MASSSSAPALAASLGAPSSQKLTRANYLFWKTLVFPPLRGAQVLDLLDGRDATPATHLEAEDSEGKKKKKKIPNPDYATWVAKDSTVLGWILNSLSPEVLAHTISVESTAEVWTIINNICGSRSRSRINQLRGALSSTKKLELSASVFFAKMKGFASELAAVGKPVPEDEMIGYIVGGLDGSYNDVAASVNGNARRNRTDGGSPPLPTLQAVVVDKTVVTVAVHQTTVTAGAHALQTAVTVAAGSAGTTAVVMTVLAGKIVVVMMADKVAAMVASDGKTAVLHGVMMVAMSAAVMMEDMTAVDVVMGVFPHPMWT